MLDVIAFIFSLIVLWPVGAALYIALNWND